MATTPITRKLQSLVSIYYLLICVVLLITPSYSSTATTAANTNAELNVMSIKPPTKPEVLQSQQKTSTSNLKVSDGTHYVHIYVGTPPQKVTVILDTGSHFTAFPCVGCRSCGRHTDPPFDWDKSGTARDVGCDRCEHKKTAKCEDDEHCIFSQSYTEGSSWEAIQVEDVLFFGEDSLDGSTESQKMFTKIDFVFGCQRKESGLFTTQKVDGIMGLAMHENGLMSHIADNDSSPQKMFSLCFTPDGGTFTLGGIETGYHAAVVQYTKLVKNSGWYSVQMKSLYLGDTLVTNDVHGFNSGKGVIIDSGTSDTYLPKYTAKEFKAVWKELVGRKYSNEKEYFTDDEFKRLPSIHFVFEGGERLTVLAKNYMEKSKAGPHYWISRVYLDEPKGAVLGANSMLYHDILFDEKNLRLGWATSTCGGSSG